MNSFSDTCQTNHTGSLSLKLKAFFYPFCQHFFKAVNMRETISSKGTHNEKETRFDTAIIVLLRFGKALKLIK
jgi:hypothetical protein